MIKVFVPRDAAALSMGADAVAKAIAAEAKKRNAKVEIVRNGSRGMLWLEPLVEVETENGRVAYGPVKPADVPSLFKAKFLNGEKHKLWHGLTDEIPYFKNQERLTFARCGLTDPLSIEDYRAHGGFDGLTNALTMAPLDIVTEVTTSGLRGRGGAGFPTGIKWKTVHDARADQKYICCNADEGDSGTFADRMLMEGDPYCLIEGMTIAGIAVGATKGYIYCRSEYPHAVATLREAVRIATEANWLGRTIQGSPHDFELYRAHGRRRLHLRRRNLDAGKPRRPSRHRPLQAAAPGASRACSASRRSSTTCSASPRCRSSSTRAASTIATSASANRAARSPSSSPATSSRAVSSRKPSASPRASSSKATAAARFPAVRSARRNSAVRSAPTFQMTSSIPKWTTRRSSKSTPWSATAASSSSTIRSTWPHMARFAMEFCVIESCGKCTPCRIGSVRGVETMDRIIAGVERERNIEILEDLCDTMTDGSLCAMGGLTPMPVMSALRHFPEDFNRPARAEAAE